MLGMDLDREIRLLSLNDLPRLTQLGRVTQSCQLLELVHIVKRLASCNSFILIVSCCHLSGSFCSIHILSNHLLHAGVISWLSIVAGVSSFPDQDIRSLRRFLDILLTCNLLVQKFQATLLRAKMIFSCRNILIYIRSFGSLYLSYVFLRCMKVRPILVSGLFVSKKLLRARHRANHKLSLRTLIQMFDILVDACRLIQFMLRCKISAFPALIGAARFKILRSLGSIQLKSVGHLFDLINRASRVDAAHIFIDIFRVLKVSLGSIGYILDN